MTAALIAGCTLVGFAVGAMAGVAVERVPQKVRVFAGPFPEPARWVRQPLGVLVTVGTGALFGATAARFEDNWALPAYLVLMAGLVVLSLIDLRTHLLPNRIVYPLTVAVTALLALAALIDSRGGTYGRALLAGLVAFFAFLTLHLIAPGGLGFGDVKLSFVLGLALGWLGWGELAVGLFLAFAYGAVIGIALIATKVRGRKDPVPFGPFLAAGTITAILVGYAIVDAYKM